MKKIFLTVFLMTFLPNAYAGVIAKKIQAACPEQYSTYKSTVDEYAIRMRDYVDAYGCGVVSAYGVFMEKNQYRIEQWEDDEQAFEEVNYIFLFAEKYDLNISAKPILFDALSALINSTYNLDDLDDIFSAMTRHEHQRMSKSPERILYLMWALQVFQYKSSDDIFQKADRLRRYFSAKELPLALILNGSIAEIYPKYSAQKKLDLVRYVFHTYSKGFMLKVALDKQALPNLVFLLPPQAGDIKGSQGLTDRDIERLQNDYVEAIQEVVKSFEDANVNFGAAVDSAGVLAPFIQQALVVVPDLNQDIISYLTHQIHSSVFQTYIKSQGDCNESEFSSVVANFFTFLAPFKEVKGSNDVAPVLYLQNNLARIAKWYHNDSNFSSWIKEDMKEPDRFIRNMTWLPYFYEKTSPRSKKYMSKLMYNLPDSPNVNASFIVALYKGTTYFNWVGRASDANQIVVASEDTGDQSLAKYRYILTTPFPSQDDASVFERFIQDGSGISAVSLLQGYSVDDLSSHTFTQSEKLLATLGNIDNAIMIASIVAVPLTGGASLVLLGAKMAAKQVAKKGLKYGMKVGYRYVRKTVARNTRRTFSRLAGKKGKKAFVRESKEMAGLAKKRGRPSHYAGNQAKMTSAIIKGEGVSSAIQFSIVASGIATAIYCNNFTDHSSKPWIRSLCHTQDETPASENVCKNFKQGVF